MPSAQQISANRKTAKKAPVLAPKQAGRHHAEIRDGMAVAIRTDSAFHDDIEYLAKNAGAVLRAGKRR